MVSVTKHHALFQLKDGVKKAQEVANKHFDAYDDANQKDARKFLLNSVDKHLEKQLYENCKSDDLFVTYWLNLMRLSMFIAGSVSRRSAREQSGGLSARVDLANLII